MDKFKKPLPVKSYINMEDKDSEDKKVWLHFTLRIRKDLLEDIEKVLEKRIGISKTAWILEAIQEKLKTEE